ncbi:metallophosphoesterase [Tumidithrix elongata RA019]|uniref:Metallophosphoesterase n=1 Tax=Tumidithrix elongata BACA0141 TaxID=2716417 RepID=A0AAW9Q0V9_9CYAN|nr:metallophosphoesterase [Tumidithrix elongata RA019]
MAIGRRFIIVGLGASAGALVAGGVFAKLNQGKSNPTQANNTPDSNPQTPSTTQPTQIAANTSGQPLLRFAAVADTGTGDRGQYAVAEAMAATYKQKAYPLVILGGDNIYNDGEIEKIKAVFEDPYAPLLNQGVKFHAVLGNHDIRTKNGADQLAYAPFHMPTRYYTFRTGANDAVQFFAIDTNVNAPWQEQLAWLDKSLAASDAPWKIVVGHHPIYSSGHYGNTAEFIRDLSPLFKKYNVQLYLCGHDHDYERSLPIKGTTYIVHGGGANTRPVGKSATTAYSAAERSFVLLEVYADKIVTEAIDTKGQVFDRGTIALKST